MSRINNLIERSGILYSVERNGEIISQFKGLINTEQSTTKRYIGFYPDVDIQSEDILINPYGDKYHVSNREVQTFAGKPNQLKCFVTSETEYKRHSQSTAPTFHIENAYGSVIGTQENVTLNYNESIKNAKELISSSDSEDKEELQQIVSLLEKVVDNQIPIQKGLFSKFSAVMERNSWIAGTISSTLLSWLLTQI